VGGIDTLARSLLVAAALIEGGALLRAKEKRYDGWSGELGRAISAGQESLDSLEKRVMSGAIDPRPVSGQQEFHENEVNRTIWTTA